MGSQLGVLAVPRGQNACSWWTASHNVEIQDYFLFSEVYGTYLYLMSVVNSSQFVKKE